MNYPFLQSLRSALPLCDEFVLNLGDCTDDSERGIHDLSSEFPGKIRILRTSWEKKNQTGGSQLRIQTDRALAECQGRWCLYLQADEVLHEADYSLIRAAIKAAEERPDVDGIVFDYLHFYGNYDYVIRGRSWYRREARILRNHRGIAAFRDAQGFRINGKRLRAIISGARVFHYGHVHSTQASLARREEMATWWGENANLSDPRLRFFHHVGLMKFGETHPAVMAERLKSNSHCVDPLTRPRVWTMNEFRDRITLFWESVVPCRLGEFRNYDLY